MFCVPRVEVFTCHRCHETKPTGDFPRNPSAKRGHDLKCKACRNDLRRGNREFEQRGNILRKYGLTREQYQEMYEAVEGRCQVCFTPQEVLCVDHCHSSGKVRGLLCKKCNLGIGYLQDDLAILEQAKEYLSVANDIQPDF